MPSYDNKDDVFGSSSHFLSPSTSLPRKSTRQSINNRRSTASLRGSSNPTHVMDNDAVNGRHSLAHELAVALMPEPSAGSKLLAEEFGIEYDEGAEGIDEEIHLHDGVQVVVETAPSYAGERISEALNASFHDAPSPIGDALSDYDTEFGSPVTSTRQKEWPEQDAMEVLAFNLESTDKFLLHLRRLEIDSGSSMVQQPALERIASDVIRRINETARDREGQVRELLECEREFRKIAGEVGGSEVLGRLDELANVGDLSDTLSVDVSRPDDRHLDALEEEPHVSTHLTHDWEMDPDRHHLGDEDDDIDSVSSPVKDSFPPPPPVFGPLTPAKTITQLSHFRSLTTSLVTSLTTISEQAQVNGAATTEAGRKIRALKNKLGGWRTDWDSAERSRVKIEKWEAGIVDNEVGAFSSPIRPSAVRRIDGRKVVEEHLRAFELALADAAVKTKAIMAS